MRRTQRRYNRRNNAQHERDQEGFVQTRHEHRDDRGEAAHATAGNEDLLHRAEWEFAECEREDDGDTEHLARIVEHVKDACRRASCVWLDRTHDGVGVWGDEEAGTAAHDRHEDRQQPERGMLVDGGKREERNSRNAQTNGGQDARTDTVRESSAEGANQHKGRAKRNEQQACSQGVLPIDSLQEEDQQEEYRAARNAVEQAAQVRQREETAAEKAQLHQRNLDTRLDHNEKKQEDDAND